MSAPAPAMRQPSPSTGGQRFGALGKMTGHRLELPHAVRTEPLAQRIDQGRATLGCRSPIPRRRSTISSVCRAGMRFGAGDGKPDRLEAEAGILRRRQRLELEIDEARHMGDVARRQRQPDIDRLHRAIDAVEESRKRARADIVAARARAPGSA